MLEFMHNFDITHWVTTLGYVGIITIIFLETGVFACFFLPGDSLVFSAGLLAAKGIFNIEILVPALIVTAFARYTLGYWFGNKLGYWLMKQPESFFFKKKYITQAHEFYERHGGKALVLGRLVPVVRTFVPIVAGMANMPHRRYVIYNVIGAVLWGGGVTMAGYYLGSILPQASSLILPIVLVIVVISVIPGVVHYFKQRRKQS